MEQMLPPDGPLWPGKPPVRVAARGGARSKAKVAMLTGCVGQVMFADVNRQAWRLLAACGADVLIPRSQACCGAIPHHSGQHSPAVELAKRNIDLFLRNDDEASSVPDLITTTIAGCGAMLREYDFLLRDDPEYADRARLFASKVRDISEVLLELGLPELKHEVRATATYHDACHLIHAQKVAAQPRELLAEVPGLNIVPLHESDMCCGAAGTYNLTQPAMATALAERKLNHIAATGAELCITGNVGCAMHIASQAAARGQAIRVEHPVTVLHRAVFGTT
jgi:glycolate oxidase iron-sulfur subunit